MRRWAVQTDGFPEIYYREAETANKARYASFRAFIAAGYRDRRLTLHEQWVRFSRQTTVTPDYRPAINSERG